MPRGTAGAGPGGTPEPGQTPPGVEGAVVDWEALQERAVALMRRAYAPYSRYPVGVAGLVDDGRIVAG